MPKLIYGNQQPDTLLSIIGRDEVGLIINQTSVVDNANLADTLLSLQANVKCIFAPEHGFRGIADAGETFNDSIDKKTSLPIYSIYGDNKKPKAEQIKGLKWLVFDIQDIGVRFFTYISTMHYAMEACAENGINFIVLDRPNPNGHYVDGPVLDTTYRSFVGMHPIPVVHGLTVGELAQMINGEGWLKNSVACSLQVVKMTNYKHNKVYHISVKPSPNLPNDLSIRLYPSLGFFEATDMSIGRGTHFPFQVIGGPDSTLGSFTFTPVSIEGMSKYPPHKNKTCYGVDLRNIDSIPNMTLSYFIDFYEKSGKDSSFISRPEWLKLLAGNSQLYHQITSGLNEDSIRASWQPGLDAYKKMRNKYLLYP